MFIFSAYGKGWQKFSCLIPGDYITLPDCARDIL